MRTTSVSSLFMAAASLAVLAGCTVKDVDAPALAGPSTFTHSIVLTTDRNTLTQNGVDFTDIRITSVGPNGQSESIPLTAQIFVGGVAQDFGTLSTKNPVTPTTIRYTAPPPSANPLGQAESTVTIAVTPTSSGDFRGETSREIDLRLMPQGVILPTNPSLVPQFTVNPATPQAMQTVTFNASATTNGGTACQQACSYAWDFGDGQTGTGITTSHQYARSGNFAVRLTVTDARGAQQMTSQTVTVAAPTPPTVSFKMSPTPAPVNGDVFFNASETNPAAGRTITSYEWDFGDGSFGRGVAVSHRYTGQGLFTIILVATDDAGAVGRATQTLQVGTVTQSIPVANVTATPTSGKPGQRVVFDASASTPSTGSVITTYRFDYGDGTPVEVVTNPVQSHVYASAGTFIANVEITDSNGKTATKQTTITITP